MKPPLKVGDLVTSRYGDFGDHAHVVRRVTEIHATNACGSGWRASADGGEPCPACGKSAAESIHGVDSAWFDPIDKERGSAMNARDALDGVGGVKVYYRDESVTIYLGSSLGMLQREPIEGVLVTDPPYGCRATTGRGGAYDGFSLVGDDSTEARDLALAAYPRAFIVFGSPRVRSPECKARLIWSKGEHTGMGDLSFPWKPDYEDIYVGGEGFSGKRTSSVLRYTALTSSKRRHPTEKPLPLMENLIGKCPPGVIVDPFMGSGTTLVAARSQGRKAVGFEVEEKYCDAAVTRLAQKDLGFA